MRLGFGKATLRQRPTIERRKIKIEHDKGCHGVADKSNWLKTKACGISKAEAAPAFPSGEAGSPRPRSHCACALRARTPHELAIARHGLPNPT
jgi:hypothetical protein